MPDLEFEVAKRRTTVITFTLGIAPDENEAHVYNFTPPKAAIMMMPILEPNPDEAQGNLDLTRATFDWLGAGLSEEDNERIKARLKNAQDDLDVEHLGKVVEGLSEKVSGNPTT